MKTVNGILCMVLLLFSSCAIEQKPQTDTTPPPSIRNFSVQEAHQIIQSNTDVIVLDVRTADEYTGPLGHISGTILKPVQEIENWAGELDDMKEREIVFVCRSGGRSARAANFFKERGFSNLINMSGGMTTWNKAGFPVEKDAQ